VQALRRAPVRDRGFDHTTQGAYAVVAGVSRALGLDVERARNATAIAGASLNALRVTRTTRLTLEGEGCQNSDSGLNWVLTPFSSIRERRSGRSCAMPPGSIGPIALNEELERRLNPGDRPVVLVRAGLRVGSSRIVQTKNDYTVDREVMNGEIVFILDWEGEEGEARLSLDDGEREIVVPLAALEAYSLAWALTGHRAQGSQFPAVVAPWSPAYSHMLWRALLYTAVTRAQRLCVLVGERRAVAMALARAEQRRRYSGLVERIVAPR
jgi:ATP-dependent exoDNAse (exonuclease V) alpha subunit